MNWKFLKRSRIKLWIVDILFFSCDVRKYVIVITDAEPPQRILFCFRGLRTYEILSVIQQAQLFLIHLVFGHFSHAHISLLVYFSSQLQDFYSNFLSKLWIVLMSAKKVAMYNMLNYIYSNYYIKCNRSPGLQWGTEDITWEVRNAWCRCVPPTVQPASPNITQDPALFMGMGTGEDSVKGAPASEAQCCQHSKVESREWSEQPAARVQGPLQDPGSFWVFDAQICIFTHSTYYFFYYFLYLFSHSKFIKITALHFISIYLIYSYILHLFVNLHEKQLSFDWMTWGMPSKARLQNVMTWVVKNKSIVWVVRDCFSLIPQSMSSHFKYTVSKKLTNQQCICFHVTRNVSCN